MTDIQRLEEAERNLILAMVNNGMDPAVAVSFIMNFGEC